MGEPQLPSWMTCQGNCGSLNELGLIPVQDVVGFHVIEVLVVDPRDHGESVVDPPREESHPLVLGAFAGDQADVDRVTARVLEQLRKGAAAVVGREGSVVDVAAVCFGESHEPQVFDAVPFEIGERKDDDLDLAEDRRTMGKVKLMIDARERDQRIGGFFERARRLLLLAHGGDRLGELVAREAVLETVEDRPEVLFGQPRSWPCRGREST